MSVQAALHFTRGARAGWWIAAVVTVLFGVVTLGAAVLTPTDPGPRLVLAGLGALYLWVGAGARRVVRGRPARVVVEDGHVAVFHDGLLGEPLLIGVDDLDAVHVDPRPLDERRAAAANRRGGVVTPSFHERSLPVVSAHPSSHGSWGSGAPPNLVLRFAEPRHLPGAPLVVRFLLRVANGRSGRYDGPTRRRAAPGLRLVVDGVAPVAAALEAAGLIMAAPRDERYLAPVTDRDRSRRRRDALVVVAILAGIIIVGTAVAILSGS